MGIKDRVQGEFSSLPPFTDALEKGVQEEVEKALQPFQAQLDEITSQLAALGITVQTAVDTANAANDTANSALSTASSTSTSSGTGGGGTTGSTTGGTTTGGTTGETIPPTSTPTPEETSTDETPTPTPTPRVVDQLVLALADPFLLDAPVATVTGGGTYAVGDAVTLRASNVRTGYTFDGWYNQAGQRVSGDIEYTFTVQSGGGAFTARFTTGSVETPTSPVTPEPTDSSVTITIKWVGVTNGTRNVNGQLVRDLRIGTNPGDVTQVGQPVPQNTEITTRVTPGVQLVLTATGGIRPPVWRIEGTDRNLDTSFNFRPTTPTTDTTYVAVFFP